MSLFVEPQMSPSSGGENYSAAKYYFYDSGTTTLATIYADADRTTPQANPVVADGGGVFPAVWLDPTKLYRRVLQNSAGATLRDLDPYPANPFDQDSLGRALYPLSDEERSIGLTDSDIEKPWLYYGNVRRLGNDATALQNTINLVAIGGYGDVIAPRGEYSLGGDIYFYYDATNNPNFPQNFDGMINIVGEGWQDYNGHVNSVPQGTIFDIGSNQFKIGNGSTTGRGVRFKNCTVTGNSTSYLVKYDLTSRGSGFEDFTLFQDGVGGGIEMDDTFNIVLDNMFVATTNGSNTGTGLYVHNSSQAAGDYDFRSVSVVGFNKNWILGEEGTSASSMSNIVMDCCQGKDGNYNLILGGGAKSAVINSFHNEGPKTIGIVVAYGARHIRISAPYNSSVGASGDYMALGLNTGTDSTDYCADVSVLHGTFLAIKNYGIRVYTSASVINREIAYCRFVGSAGTETAIDLENAAQHGLAIGPNTYVTVAVTVSNPTRVDINRAGDTLGTHTFQAPLALTGGVTGKVLFDNEIEIDGALNHDGSTAGFYGTTPVSRPSVTWPNTATATTTLNEAKANRLMAALVALGLIVTT